MEKVSMFVREWIVVNKHILKFGSLVLIFDSDGVEIRI